MPLKDPQKRREYNKRYRLKNKERLRIKNAIWRKKNKEIIAKKKTEYWFKVRKEKSKKWSKCIKCNKDILGTYKRKYCNDCLKKKMSNLMKGNQYWKLVENRPKGKNSPNWKDGITFWKKRIWDSPKYKEWRKEVFERDNYTCQNCGIRNEEGLGKTIKMEAHHLKSFTETLREYNIHSKEEADKCDKLWEINLGQTLCYQCHQLTKNGNPRKKRK